MSLSAVLVNGAPFVAICPICEALGLNWSAQFRRISRDPELKATVFIMNTVAEDGKIRQIVCLPLDRLNSQPLSLSRGRKTILRAWASPGTCVFIMKTQVFSSWSRVMRLYWLPQLSPSASASTAIPR